MLHAHILFESRDCDGTQSGSRRREMTTEEAASEFGDLEFKQRMIAELVSVVAEDATLIIRPDRISWHENTEEGYHTGDAEWCEEDH